MAIPEELLKLMNPQGGFNAPPAIAPSTAAPLAAPTVGPTIANAAQLPQVSAPQPFDPAQFFGARAPEGNGVTLPDVGAAGQIRQPAQAPNALLDLAEREGALGPSISDINAGRATPISGGGEAAPIIPQIQPNALGGVPRPEAPFGLADPSSSTATGPDPFSGPAQQIATPATAAANQPFGLRDPSSTQVGANAPLGVDATQARLGDIFGEAPQTLSEVTANDPASIAAREATASFEQESLARDARQEDMLQSRAQSRLDQRGGASEGGAISQSDQADMAKGRAAGASAGDKARAATVAARNGLDPITGRPLESAGSASELERAQTTKVKAETLSILDKIGNKSKELNLSPADTARDKAAGTALAAWDNGGRATVTSNITSLDKIVEGLEDGQIKTRGFVDALPFGSDWARAIVNPQAQDAKNRVEGVIFQTLKETLGAQFTEREGKRLVEASYNPMLDPATNAARLRDYSNGLKKAVEARESMLRYLAENDTLKDYNGATPAGIMSQVGAGANGSPIQGDVNVASAADEIMSAQ